MTTEQWVSLGWTAFGGLLGLAVFFSWALLRERRDRRKGF
jgi:hypothetical protein